MRQDIVHGVGAWALNGTQLLLKVELNLREFQLGQKQWRNGIFFFPLSNLFLVMISFSVFCCRSNRNYDNNLQRPYFVSHCSSHIEILLIIKFIALNMSIPRLMKGLMMLGMFRLT